jgi:NTP pyrophosphatase (non-canonical NTP hydrolase)
VNSKSSVEHRNGGSASKKALILEAARAMDKPRFTAAEIEQIRRRLIAKLGPQGNTSEDYIGRVLEEAGLRVAWAKESDSDAASEYDEELSDLLHFSTLADAEMCLIRLDELLRKFHSEHKRGGEQRIREVALLGRRRAEMIARNRKVEPHKRAEKEEIARWFGVWLETPDAFFDWLEVRKQSPEFQKTFPSGWDEEV